MKATALKPPGQSMNAEQRKDDRRHYSSKVAGRTDKPKKPLKPAVILL